jgi:hypothetical protein
MERVALAEGSVDTFVIDEDMFTIAVLFEDVDVEVAVAVAVGGMTVTEANGEGDADAEADADADAEAEAEEEGRAVNEENMEYEGGEDWLTVALELGEDVGLYVALALGVQLRYGVTEAEALLEGDHVG